MIFLIHTCSRSSRRIQWVVRGQSGCLIGVRPGYHYFEKQTPLCEYESGYCQIEKGTKA